MSRAIQMYLQNFRLLLPEKQNTQGDQIVYDCVQLQKYKEYLSSVPLVDIYCKLNSESQTTEKECTRTWVPILPHCQQLC